MWDLLLRSLALTAFCLPSLLPPAEPPLPEPAEWTHDARLPPPCGLSVVIDALVAHPLDRHDPEQVVLVSHSPITLDLRRWELRAGRRKVPLDGLTLAPGARLHLEGPRLGSLQLRNRDGELRLFDRCGQLRDHVAWTEAPRGAVWRRAEAAPAAIAEPALLGAQDGALRSALRERQPRAEETHVASQRPRGTHPAALDDSTPERTPPRAKAPPDRGGEPGRG